MTVIVSAAEARASFERWHERALAEPVQITEDGRESAYLISAATFHELWASYRRRVEVRDLTDEEMAMIMAAEVPLDSARETEDEPSKPSGDDAPAAAETARGS